MTQTAITALIVGICAFSIWSFAILLQNESNEPTVDEVAQIDEELQNQLEPTGDGNSTIIGVSQVSQVRIMPLPNWLPGYQLSPHKFMAIIGIAGSLLLGSGFLWCMFVPRTISVRSAWTEDTYQDFTSSVEIHHEDGSVERFDLSGSPTQQAEQGGAHQPATRSESNSE